MSDHARRSRWATVLALCAGVAGCGEGKESRPVSDTGGSSSWLQSALYDRPCVEELAQVCVCDGSGRSFRCGYEPDVGLIWIDATCCYCSDREDDYYPADVGCLTWPLE